LEPDITNALAAVERKEYDIIYLATSNADAAAASTTSGPGRLKTHIAGLDEGRRAKLQQAIIATTGTLSAAKVGADQHNFAPFCYLHSEDGQSLPAEWGGAELGQRIREETVRPNTNRAELAYRATLYGPADLTADALTDIEVESALQSGVTPVVYDATDTPAPARPITTYYKDAAGAPDDRVLDVPIVSGVYALAKYLRTSLPRTYKGKSIAEDQPAGSEPLPDGVIEIGEIRAEVISLVQDFIALGVVDRTTWETKLVAGLIVVRINPQDATQVDVVLPVGIVPILAKLGVVVNQVGVVR
jgi:phage tail sheath gpL-like